ncbi:hypothetical protein PM082_022849 [Marasmius tenuissimus]|nr:hypothetical protein PM082_022849 [Marasmius tenuissimus]
MGSVSTQPPGSPPDWFYPGIAQSILFHTISSICQTFFFGIYASLTIYSTYYMLTTGFKNGVRKTLFTMSMIMFFVSSIFWVTEAINLIRLISVNLVGHKPPPPLPDWVTHASLISSAFVLINYALTDAVVLWRAWVLCRTELGRVLYIPLFFLCCTSISIVTTIVIRITIQAIPHPDATMSDPRIKSLTRAIDICQVGNLVFSSLVNTSATSLVAVKAWRFRRWIKFDLDALGSRRTRGERIMATLVESGLLYCLSGITVLITTVIRLPVGTVGNIYTPINTQIAGMYPIVVLLLVSHGKTLENTVFPRNTSNNNPASEAGPLESMRFGRVTIDLESYSRHVISGDQMASVLRSPNDRQPSPKSKSSMDGYAANGKASSGSPRREI